MNVIEAIESRRSVRKFKTQPVKEEDIRKIMRAAQLAPSAGNKQPWRFIVVSDPERKKELAKIASNQTWIGEAGLVMVCLAMDKKSPEVYERWTERDVMSAVEHMVLTAWELGYGSCWIGAFHQGELKSYLEIPEGMTVISLLPIGVPDQTPSPRRRKPIKELFYSEKYGNPIEI